MKKKKQSNGKIKTLLHEKTDNSIIPLLQNLNILTLIRTHLFPLLLIAIISFSVYANTLNNGFVYDDERTIVTNTFIKKIGNLPKLFNKEDYFAASSEITYRPAVTFTYFLDYTFYGLNPLGYHLTNIILHGMNGVLLFIFLSLVFEQSKTRNPTSGFSLLSKPLLISLLFVTHPILTETVNLISYREDLLAFLFYFATLIMYMRLRSNSLSTQDTIKIYLLSCITYALALLSKEPAATLPIIIFGYEWFCETGKKSLRSLVLNRYNIGFIIITLLYICLRFYYFYNPMEGERNPALPLAERLLTIPWVIVYYIKLLIFPLTLSADYLEPVIIIKSVFSTSVICPLFALIFLSFLFFKSRNREIFFGTFFSS